MSVELAPGEEACDVAEALRRKILRRGLTEAQVAERAGIDESELREILDGAPTLRVEQVHAVLAAVGIPPVEFYLDLFGPPRAAIHDFQPGYYERGTSIRVFQRLALRMMIWKLGEKGVFTQEQVDRMHEELEAMYTLREPPF